MSYIISHFPLPCLLLYFFNIIAALWVCGLHAVILPRLAQPPPPSSPPSLPPILWTELHIGITQGSQNVLSDHFCFSSPLAAETSHFCFVCVFVKGFHGYTMCCRILISMNLIVTCNASRLHCSLATILSIVFMQ